MSLASLEALRHSLIAAQLMQDPALRGLALSRYGAAEEAIAAQPEHDHHELHELLFRMLPSEWPLWVETSRALNAARAH